MNYENDFGSALAKKLKADYVLTFHRYLTDVRSSLLAARYFGANETFLRAIETHPGLNILCHESPRWRTQLMFVQTQCWVEALEILMDGAFEEKAIIAALTEINLRRFLYEAQ